MSHTGAKTKRAAIVTAVEAFNSIHRLADLAERLQGSCPNFMSQEELQHLREDRKWETAP